MWGQKSTAPKMAYPSKAHAFGNMMGTGMFGNNYNQFG